MPDSATLLVTTIRKLVRTGAVIGPLCFSLLLLTGCNPETSDELPQHVRELDPLIVLQQEDAEAGSLTLTREQVFRDSLLLEEISGVAVGESGEVWFSGRSWKREEVFRFGADGTLLERFGEFGSDKGQFTRLSGMQLANDSLYLFDEDLGRVTMRAVNHPGRADTLEISVSDSLFLESYHRVVPLYRFESGDFLVELRDTRNPVYYSERFRFWMRYDPDRHHLKEPALREADTAYLIGDYAGRPVPFTLSLPGKPGITVSEDDQLFLAYTDEYLIRQYSFDGHFQQAWYGDVKPEPLSPEEDIFPEYGHNEQLLKIRESAEYPDAWPAIASVLADDEGRLWVARIKDEPEFEWWILDEQGAVAVFRWPRERQIRFVKNGFVYTSEPGENGFQDMVRYRISSDLP